MSLSIKQCAESIATRLLTVCMGSESEATGDRLAVKKNIGEGGEHEIGGRNYASTVEAVEEELRDWLKINLNL